MNFDCIERRLSRWYSHVEEDGTVYYADNNGKTVATKTGKLIVMYFACSPDIIWNHRDMVAVAVAKDFVLTNEYQKTVADVVSVMGLCGSYNTFTRIGNQLLILSNSFKNCIGTLGRVTANGIFYFDKGAELVVPEELTYFDSDSLSYGLLSKRTTRRRKKSPSSIQPKDYHVYSYLRKKNDWYWESGFGTCGFDKERSKINYTQNGTNYHLCCKVHFR